MKNKLFISGLITFALSLLVIIVWALVRTNFNFTYPLDDSYIHLSIAKNLAKYSIWGVTKFEFTSASSSPLYTVLLALVIKIFGNNLYIPLILNIIIGVIFIFVVSKFISNQFVNLPKIYQYLLLNIFILFLPLHTIVFIAMEHTLHCLFIFLLISKLYLYLNGELKNNLLLPMYAFLSISTRYETLFILLPIGLLLLFKKDYKLLMYIVISSAISIFGFGLYFISQGGRLLPYSVLVKGQFPGFTLLGIKDYISMLPIRIKRNDASAFALAYLIFTTIYIYFKSGKKINQLQQLLFISITTIAIHLLVAGDGFFFRYQSYLLTMLLFCIVLIFSQMKSEKIIYSYLLILVPIICLRIALSLYKTPQASMNIYEQQIHLSNYLQKHKEIKKLALNDIGAMTYFNEELQILDFWGLGTQELSEFVIWEKKSGLDKNYTNKLKMNLIIQLSEKKQITHAILYPRVFSKTIPANWNVYDSLLISNNYSCGDNLVYFYKVK